MTGEVTRRDFLKLTKITGIGILGIVAAKYLPKIIIDTFSEPLPIKKSEELLLEPRIFVANDGMAFFDVNNPKKEPTNIAEIVDKQVYELYWQPYNYLVGKGETHYFETNGYKGHTETISVTTYCIVLCAFTRDKNGRIKSSGVYHYRSFSSFSLIKLPSMAYKLIHSLRTRPDETVTVKAAGGKGSEEDLQIDRFNLTWVLGAMGVEIQPHHLVLGGDSYHRKTEFHPETGQLVTYFYNEKEAIVL